MSGSVTGCGVIIVILGGTLMLASSGTVFGFKINHPAIATPMATIIAGPKKCLFNVIAPYRITADAWSYVSLRVLLDQYQYAESQIEPLAWRWCDAFAGVAVVAPSVAYHNRSSLSYP